MTTIQKTFIGVIVALAVASGIYEARQASGLRNQVHALEQQRTSLADQLQQVEKERDELNRKLASSRDNKERLNPSAIELLKLRNEVTRLRPLEKDVVALQKMVTQSIVGLPTWKANQLTNAGKRTPLDALQTYLWSSTTTNLSELEKSLVPDPHDPPSADRFHEFVGDNNNHLAGGVMTNLNVISQTVLSSDEAVVEIYGKMKGEGGYGISFPMTLKNVDGEWKVVVFNNRDSDGKSANPTLVRGH